MNTASPRAERVASFLDWIGRFKWWQIALVPLLIIALISGQPSVQRDAERDQLTDLQKFWLAAQVTVREHLENPDEAVFCAANDPRAETLTTTNSRYGEGAAMRGWVKEKRLDGTWRLLAWGALIAHNKDGFRALGCQINEREFGVYKDAGRQ